MGELEVRVFIVPLHSLCAEFTQSHFDYASSLILCTAHAAMALLIGLRKQLRLAHSM